MIGSFGDMGCFSFYANKIITTGEGGMVTTNDDRLAEQLRLLRNLAFTTPRFRHELAGHNFRMTGYQGALGLSQMRRIEQVLARKREVAAVLPAAPGGHSGPAVAHRETVGSQRLLDVRDRARQGFWRESRRARCSSQRKPNRNANALLRNESPTLFAEATWLSRSRVPGCRLAVDERSLSALFHVSFRRYDPVHL